MDDEDLDWQVDGSWEGADPPSTQPSTAERGRRRVRPRTPLCTEDEPGLPGRRGPTGLNDYADPRYRASAYQRDYEMEVRRSYRRAGIDRRIEILHGGLLARAGRRAPNLSYQDWVQLRDDPDLGRDIISAPIMEALNQIRDAGIDRILGESVRRLLGSPLTYATGLQMLFEEASWNAPSASERNAHRTRLLYGHMLGVLAHNLADGNEYRASRINRRLVSEGIRYLRWRTRELPRIRRWVRQNVPESERRPQWQAR